ncbi:MAG: glycogen debranching enzyme family protein [Lachnospiraceae bacterium]|nr:glycogen debranching enzyme family protein [Lachnospiraceae bacterium]
MRFQYGKQDWKTLKRGEENCYLMTNGLGGFSSLSLIASCSRNDQAVLMACVHSPNNRYNMIHRLEETITIGDTTYMLSSQDFQCHKTNENGYVYQSGFVFEDYPIWSYLVEGVEVTRKIVLMQGKNNVGISYEIQNRSGKAVTLKVTPQLQFVPKGVRLPIEQEFIFEEQETGYAITSNNQTLYLQTNGACKEIEKCFCDKLYYSSDVADGKIPLGRSAANHEIIFTVDADVKDTLEMVYGMESELPTVAEITENVVTYRKQLHEKAGFTNPIADQLAVSADQFISYRASTGKQTILAGFPFFEDWGRDTMIALMGCCLSTKRYEEATAILETFMFYCKKGLMPNIFPEGTADPGYNTVDAALLLLIAVNEYYTRTQDKEFVKRAYPVMKEIVDWYKKGTDYNIHMDEDGLIMAGGGYDQVTWMDVRVENILPTPRHGKPVEINAYWYNGLRIMEHFCTFIPEEADKASEYASLAEKVKESFTAKFWNEEAGCLKDVLSDTPADTQIRCNQIWAVSLPYSLLPRDKEIQVVETVFRKLYTPYGLRTLAPEDAQYHPFYGGAPLDRDLAYHQGTVWPFPMGGYYLAYLKVHDYSEEAKAYVLTQLSHLEGALREGCAGQLPEIYDGENPTESKGCFAQAWSVGELLRVYEAIQ